MARVCAVLARSGDRPERAGPPTHLALSPPSFYGITTMIYGKATGAERAMNGLMTMQMTTETWLVLALAGLVAFGVAFNRQVQRLEEETPEHGYTAFLVAAGVLVTVAVMAPLIGLQATALLLAGFVASGSPMIIGSVRRALGRMRSERELLRAEARRAMDDGDAA